MSETVELPTRTLTDGRLFIGDDDLVLNPWIAPHIRRFSNWWERDNELSGYVSPVIEGQAS